MCASVVMTVRYSHINNTKSNYYCVGLLFLTIEILILKTEFYHQVGPFLIDMPDKIANKSHILIDRLLKNSKPSRAMPNHAAVMSRSSTIQPSTYPGMPLSPYKLTKIQVQPIIEKLLIDYLSGVFWSNLCSLPW